CDQLFAAQKLNRLGPAVINKRFVCHRSVESHPIPQGNTYLSAYGVDGGMDYSLRIDLSEFGLVA
ncbi:hypothetical protein, partial [Mesorhizobium sp. L2C066B000]|uniref:hypothetical protein n=1 Tax=Mesorhizobium sp. L2C066B000 TaxID=1287105 RepID=UPI000A5E4308